MGLAAINTPGFFLGVFSPCSTFHFKLPLGMTNSILQGDLCYYKPHSTGFMGDALPLEAKSRGIHLRVFGFLEFDRLSISKFFLYFLLGKHNLESEIHFCLK